MKEGSKKVKENNIEEKKSPHSNDHNRCDSLKKGKNKKKKVMERKDIKNH